MCALAGVSRAAYYRAWACSVLRREGWCVNHKRVVRIMREDNLVCLKKRPGGSKGIVLLPRQDREHSALVRRLGRRALEAGSPPRIVRQKSGEWHSKADA